MIKKLWKKTTALFMLAGMMVLAGCASSTADTNASADMKTVQTDKGEVQIPTDAKRIVSDYYLGEFLAVDVKPIIASPYALQDPRL